MPAELLPMSEPRRRLEIFTGAGRRRTWSPEAKLALRRGEQHHSAIEGQSPAIEGGGHLLAADCWKAERLGRIVVHGGCGAG
jgi:hypothetical protein